MNHGIYVPEGTTRKVVVKVGGFEDFNLTTDQEIRVDVEEIFPEEEE